jgi:preprotein translocase subunit SecA
MTTASPFLSGFRLPRSIAHVRTSFVALVRDRERQLEDLDDDQLRDRSHTLRRKVVELDHVNDENDRATAFALMGIAASRGAQIRFYDEQLMAGYSLLRNEIAEMKTGEGKTLVGALIGYARALSGHGVHFMTTNDYLAERDYETVKPMMDRLGVSIGRIDRDMGPQQKLAAYQSDLTYGPGYEFGFDYLRDQLAMLQLPEPGLGERFQRLHRGERELSAMRMQRGHYCAIVDEADSVLIDEATTPLVLSGAAGGPTKFPQPYLLAAEIAADLEVGTHFTVDPEKRQIDLTASGQQTVVRHLDETTLGFLQRPWYGYVRQALHANFHCHKDADYVALDDQIKLVDPNTGRIFDDRTWSDGLHQAVEAKEGVTITCENRSLARISRQQYFGNYQNLC